jgi:hypothetical protein
MSRLSRLYSSLVAIVCVAVLVAGCAKKEEGTTTADQPADTAKLVPESTTPTPSGGTAQGTMPVKPSTPPSHIEVQHVLIGYQGSIPNKTITRTKDEAKALADEILRRARSGEDFGGLVQKYTDDQFPGIYKLANTGQTPGEGEYPRDGMVKGFSDAAFDLSPGNVGVASYDAQGSPYGWHIIKRLK